MDLYFSLSQNLLELYIYNMTKKEYELLSEEIEKCRLQIKRSFDDFNKFIESTRTPDIELSQRELKEEANRITIHND